MFKGVVAFVCGLVIFITRSHFSFENNAVANPQNPSFDSKVLKLGCGGFDTVVADCYWLSFIQYFGESVERTKDNYSKTLDYIKVVTDLDPNFVSAYYIAALLLGGELKEPDLAEKVLEKGIERNPKEWTLQFAAGANSFIYAHDTRKAASFYKGAARMPGAPPWLEGQARILEANIPSIVKEAFTWDGIFSAAKDQKTKNFASNKEVTLWLEVAKKAPTTSVKQQALNQIYRLTGRSVAR
ncbi:MAG TPA: hypothetical protein V6C76_15165 [Drouetiella sp.]